MNGRKFVLVLIGIFGLVGVVLTTHGLKSEALQPAQPPAVDKRDTPPADAMDNVPPGIKKGVRVQLSINQKSPFNPAKFEEGFVVEEVRGSWVRMKGEPWEGFPGKPKEISAWINFRLVEWCRILD